MWVSRLQLLSETGTQSAATLSPAELKHLTWIVLHHAEFDPSGADAGLLEGIMQAATHRLVLLAPHPGAGYGFDVRSLQELMAAKYLVSNEPAKIGPLLKTAAASPHWRNTWIFAAGALFADPLEHQHALVTSVVEEIDNDDPRRLAAVVPIAPRLALSLVDDGMVRSLPRWRNRLIKIALRVLLEPVGADFVPIARSVLRFADTGDDQRHQVTDALRSALDHSPIGRSTVGRLQQITQELCDELQVRRETRGIASVMPTPGHSPLASSVQWHDFIDDLRTQPTASIDEEVAGHIATTVQWLAVTPPHLDSRQLDQLRGLLATTGMAAAIEASLVPVAPNEPRIVLRMRDSLLPPLLAAPVGDRLKAIMDGQES